jgi:glycine/D-amino acid oxidase-like deaminating enzyme
MRLRSQETYWLLKNGIINAYPSLRENIVCDVLIIGGGITGSLMAYQLAQEGMDVVLIDKRDISLGSTSATTALLQYEIDEPLYKLIETVGMEAAVGSYLGGIEAISKLEGIVREIGLDCGFQRKSSIYVAHNTRNRKSLIKEFECRRDAGIGVQWLDSRQLSDDYMISGEGAILSDAAASVDGYRLAHGLLEFAFRNYKLRIYDHTRSESITHHQTHNIVSVSGDFTIQCNKTVYATGYETQAMLDEKIVDLISTYACVSEILSAIPSSLENNLVWDTEDPYLYLRTTSDHRMLVGGADEPFKNPERRDNLIDKKEIQLMKKFASLIPSFDIIPDFCWAGTFGVTKDALPYIGAHPKYPNSFFVLGFGGNGITFSTMGMSIISDAIYGKANRFLEYFKFGR